MTTPNMFMTTCLTVRLLLCTTSLRINNKDGQGQRLAYASNVTFPETAPADVTGLVSVVTHDATAYLPLSELVDLAAERERIAKELEKAKNGLRITEGKLANEKFVAHAPENVVNAEREKVAKYQELIAKLEESAKAMA